MKPFTKIENTFIVLLGTLCMTWMIAPSDLQTTMIIIFAGFMVLTGALGIYNAKQKE